MAWASGNFEEVNAPLDRSGSPIRCASWAVAKDPSTGSAVPNVGEPDFRLTEVNKFPETAGEPDLSSYPRATF